MFTLPSLPEVSKHFNSPSTVPLPYNQSMPQPRKLSLSDLMDTLHLVEFVPGHRYTLFIDPRAIDIQAFAKIQMDIDCSVEIIPVIPAQGMSVADTVAVRETTSTLA